MRSFPRCGQFVAIGAIQLERVCRSHPGIEFFKFAVEQDAQTRTGVDTEMKLTLGATLKILVQSFLPDDLAATLTLQPQAFGANALFPFARAFVHPGFLPGKPRHTVSVAGCYFISQT